MADTKVSDIAIPALLVVGVLAANKAFGGGGGGRQENPGMVQVRLRGYEWMTLIETISWLRSNLRRLPWPYSANTLCNPYGRNYPIPSSDSALRRTRTRITIGIGTRRRPHRRADCPSCTYRIPMLPSELDALKRIACYAAMLQQAGALPREAMAYNYTGVSYRQIATGLR